MAETLFDRAHGFVADLHDALAAPARTGEERAAYEAWRAALKRRARGIVARAERLADEAAWEIDPAGRPACLRAAHWTRTAADLGALHGDLLQARLDHRRADPALDAPRKTLAVLEQRARALFAALQEAEERRLAARVRALPEHTAEREQAEDLLVDLAQGRLNAKRCDAERPPAYGALLRREWLRPRSRLVRILEG